MFVRRGLSRWGTPFKGGGGWVHCSGLSFWKSRFRVRSWRGRPGHVPTFLRVVLGPDVQYCPCEASKQKPKSVLKGIELSYCHHSICL